ncbi:MAG: hypothetical protein HY958_01740 [Bacteroidia bacterium]|nr:hypothetical protein [Bacteroidia bacterium]
MKTTGLLAFVITLLFSFNVFGQIKSDIVATFDSKSPVIKMEQDQQKTNFAVATFKIKATDKQINDIKATALKFANFTTVIVSDTKDSDGNYTVTTKSKPHKDSEADKGFLQKLLFDFNVETVVYNGAGYTTDKFTGVVK